MPNYNVNSGQSIFDVIIHTIVDYNSMYSLLQKNGIPNILTDPLGYEIIYSNPIIIPPTISSSSFNEGINNKKFYSIPNQSVFDIVLQTYGDFNNTYKLLQDSNFNNLIDIPIPQSLFIFNPKLVNDSIFASYLSKNGIIINTSNRLPNDNLVWDGVDIIWDGEFDLAY